MEIEQAGRSPLPHLSDGSGDGRFAINGPGRRDEGGLRIQPKFLRLKPQSRDRWLSAILLLTAWS
jgi:hypothetical protein